jgi:hydroxymethylbilane synthase
VIRIGTRGSKLALWQANWVSAQLKQIGYDNELVVISTSGDVSTRPLSEVGGQGLFTKEIQRELLDNNVDVAVHSLKDLPTIPVQGLHLAAVPERESTDDCLISLSKLPFEQLPAGSRIGTGSSRRQAQLRAWRSDIVVADIRGNVDSRLRKLEEGQYDAIVLAAAGLSRLGFEKAIVERLPQERVLPAIGQGALGLECRQGDHETTAALNKLNHMASYQAVIAERSLLANLLAGCLAPVAALGRIDGDRLTLRARVLSIDGLAQVDGIEQGNAADAPAIGLKLAQSLARQGAAELIDTARVIHRPNS